MNLLFECLGTVFFLHSLGLSFIPTATTSLRAALAAAEHTLQVIICPAVQRNIFLCWELQCAGVTPELQQRCAQLCFCGDLAILATGICKVNRGMWTKANSCLSIVTCTHGIQGHSWLPVVSMSQRRTKSYPPYTRHKWLDAFPTNPKQFQ